MYRVNVAPSQSAPEDISPPTSCQNKGGIYQTRWGERYLLPHCVRVLRYFATRICTIPQWQSTWTERGNLTDCPVISPPEHPPEHPKYARFRTQNTLWGCNGISGEKYARFRSGKGWHPRLGSLGGDLGISPPEQSGASTPDAPRFRSGKVPAPGQSETFCQTVQVIATADDRGNRYADVDD